MNIINAKTQELQQGKTQLLEKVAVSFDHLSRTTMVIKAG
jgi:hypothetical protein